MTDKYLVTVSQRRYAEIVCYNAGDARHAADMAIDYTDDPEFPDEKACDITVEDDWVVEKVELLKGQDTLFEIPT